MVLAQQAVTHSWCALALHQRTAPIITSTRSFNQDFSSTTSSFVVTLVVSIMFTSTAFRYLVQVMLARMASVRDLARQQLDETQQRPVLHEPRAMQELLLVRAFAPNVDELKSKMGSILRVLHQAKDPAEDSMSDKLIECITIAEVLLARLEHAQPV
ncbi:hypothetical protein JKP88DRAFT_241260 [Tribonema minus]|uniref:Uncharacterized protein n=1 Tax=Tribonema minus TaxID=303371 RepID=A0A836CES7_9STRA|nr:hypothetical protein JKP88DRAFT_241260 [Tribonema minus]